MMSAGPVRADPEQQFLKSLQRNAVAIRADRGNSRPLVSGGERAAGLNL